MRLLLANGARVNAKDRDGKTPLDVATVEAAEIMRNYPVC
jgi:ankyrin repeat protein